LSKIDINVSEIKDRPAMPEGPYKFRIEDFSDVKTDKNGGQYIAVKLKFDYEGEVYIVSDNYLKLDSTKFRDFVKSTGHNDYVEDTIDLIGLEGTCILSQEEYEGKINNKVQKYLVA